MADKMRGEGVGGAAKINYRSNYGVIEILDSGAGLDGASIEHQ